MPFLITKEQQEHIAKYFGDLSKAIFTVGFASYFFKDFPLIWRIGCGLLALVFFWLSVILISSKQKGE